MVKHYERNLLIQYVLHVGEMNIVPEQEIEIVFIDEMPCIVLDDCNPIRGAWAPPIPSCGTTIPNWRLFIVDETTGKLVEQAPPIPTWGPSRPLPMPKPQKDFTQLQKEKTQEFAQELLDEIRKHGFHFY